MRAPHELREKMPARARMPGLRGESLRPSSGEEKEEKKGEKGKISL